MIEILNFHKHYGETVAVSNLSLRVGPGEVMGLVGPNGAGKTTTLRTLAGILHPTQGTFRIGGHDLAAQPVEAKQQLGYIPDDPRLFDVLTVWEHLEFAAAAYRVGDFEPKAEELLPRFELSEKRDTVAQKLSRGMRQKVAICCALLHDPRALLFDEPLTGLDPLAIRNLKDTIAVRAREGAAVLISSHLLALVEDLCTHLCILREGRSIFVGSLEEARSAAGLRQDASLEEVFFRTVEDASRG